MICKKIYILLLLCGAAFLFSSCQAAGILDFAVPVEPVELTLSLSPDEAASADGGMRGVLAQHHHREGLDTVLPEGAVPSAEGYVPVSFLPGLSVEEAEAVLTTAGLDVVVERQMHPTAAGVVYAVEYAGVGTDGLHYVNPAFPVNLLVSADKPVFPEAMVENTVYLTFDDGPDAHTTEILDILDCYGIKGTFFLLGDAAEKNPEAVQEIYARGHDVACHSMTHKYETIYASADNLMAEVDQWVGLMEQLGVDFEAVPKLFRYPGGSSSQYFSASHLAVMNEKLAWRGFRVYDWNIVANDALLFQCPEGMTVYDYIMGTFRDTYALKKGSAIPKIVLLHETVAETRVVLPRIIEYLMAEGCAFAPLSSLETSWTFADEKEGG